VSSWTCHCDAPLTSTTTNALPQPLAGPLLAQGETPRFPTQVEDPQSGNSAPRAVPGATLTDNDDEEEEKDLTEEDPLEWAYSMTRVPRIEVLVMQEVKHTIEGADRQDDTQSGVSMLHVQKNWVVQKGQ